MNVVDIETDVRLDSRTLRTIGQDLERIPMADFDLELSGEMCVVRGTAELPIPGEPAEAENSRGLKGWWRRFKEADPEPRPKTAPTPVERVYRLEDIQRLDEEGRSRRQAPGGNPDLYSTSQMLRVTGAYFEGRRCRLVSLLKNGAALRFDYLDGSGNRQTEKRAYSELYDFGFRLSRQRENRRPTAI